MRRELLAISGSGISGWSGSWETFGIEGWLDEQPAMDSDRTIIAQIVFMCGMYLQLAPSQAHNTTQIDI